jgi:DNA-binding transcriptional ArsR family regulator
VGELAADLPVTQPAVSQHLRVLREAKLVEARPMGTRRVYQVNRARLDLLRIYAESFS